MKPGESITDFQAEILATIEEGGHRPIRMFSPWKVSDFLELVSVGAVERTPLLMGLIRRKPKTTALFGWRVTGYGSAMLLEWRKAKKGTEND